jgi:adenylate kinase family enzyme
MEYITNYKSVVLMGKIASGKGTQAHSILDIFGGHLYSNGNNTRAAAAEPTNFGRKVKEAYEEGWLMPEWLASYWMTHALVSLYEHDLVVFEAVAKKPDEAELFHEIHTWLGRDYIVFNLDITDDEVRRRSEARARDVVDTHKSVEKRLDEYHAHTAKSVEFFRSQNKVIDINGALSPEEVKMQIIHHLTK